MARKKVGISGSLGVLSKDLSNVFKKKKGKTSAEKTAKKILQARKLQQKAKAFKIRKFSKKKSIYD